jgi:hypothetical protein
MAKKVKEKVRVQVEITWGREWNGSYLALTPGRQRNDGQVGHRGLRQPRPARVAGQDSADREDDRGGRDARLP